MRKIIYGIFLVLVAICLFVLISILVIKNIPVPGAYMFLTVVIMFLCGLGGFGILDNEL